MYTTKGDMKFHWYRSAAVLRLGGCYMAMMSGRAGTHRFFGGAILIATQIIHQMKQGFNSSLRPHYRAFESEMQQKHSMKMSVLMLWVDKTKHDTPIP